ncbi:hypothetical protein HXX76_008135 [Chlamydomonas incerta]|uniref:Guanylate cyclase domain-containing protein n=1 Tax=Chlamydomonas incerta TaxID=51695 RepID=A0A835T907_CHLIN|nr:hypothetical protein HXX76_008135 [Chlamydomonas incerta]|eukprot:KAG2433775.1 hypothetical protein HXX76_008135 [Chlamydomonas incerta]
MAAFSVPQDLTRLLPHAPALAWSSYLPFYRERAAFYDGKVVGLPTHGLTIHLYYRRDLFAAAGLRPPRTWDEAIATAKRFNGTDLDGDGNSNDYGICMWQRPTCPGGHMPLTAILSSMVQLRGEQNGMWFQPATMKSVVKTAAWLRALQTLSQLAAYSAPVPPKADVDCTYQALFSQGRCAMAFGAPIQFKYGSLEASALAAAAAAAGATAAPSRVRGRIGVAELPGSPVVLDWEADAMQPCDKARCPFAVPVATNYLVAAVSLEPRPTNSSTPAVSSGGTAGSSSSAGTGPGLGTTWVNVAPYTSWVGNVVYINAKKSPQEQLATFFLFAQALSPEKSWSLVASPVNFGPTRTQHLDPANRGRWLAYGYHPDDLDAFLGATDASLASSNIASDLRSVGATNVTLVLLRAVAQVVAGLPPAAVANATRVAYEAMFGAANMAAIGASYRASIYYGGSDSAAPGADGQHMSASSSADTAAVLVPALVASLGGLVLLGGLGIAAWRLRHHWNHALVRRIRRILPPGVGPDTTLTVTDIMDSTLLWESLPADVMDVALHLHHDCLRRLATVCGGYESMTEGDSFIFAFHGAQAALLFCLTAQDELPHLDWPEQLLQHESCKPLWAIETARHVPRQQPNQQHKQQTQHQRRRATEDGLRTAASALPPAVAQQNLSMPGSRGSSLSGAMSLTRRLLQVLSPRQTGPGAVPPFPADAPCISSGPRRMRERDSDQQTCADAKSRSPERQSQQPEQPPQAQQDLPQQQQAGPAAGQAQKSPIAWSCDDSGSADWQPAAAHQGTSFTEAASPSSEDCMEVGEMPLGPSSCGQAMPGEREAANARSGSGSGSSFPKRGYSLTGYAAGRSRLGSEALRTESFQMVQHGSPLDHQQQAAVLQPQPLQARAAAVEVSVAALEACCADSAAASMPGADQLLSFRAAEPHVPSAAPPPQQRSATQVLLQQTGPGRASATTPATSVCGVSTQPLLQTATGTTGHMVAFAAQQDQRPSETDGGPTASQDSRRRPQPLAAPGGALTINSYSSSPSVTAGARSPGTVYAHVASASPNSRSRLSLCPQPHQQPVQETAPSSRSPGYTAAAAARAYVAQRWRPQPGTAQAAPGAAAAAAAANASVKDLLNSSFNFSAELHEAMPAGVRAVSAAHKRERPDSAAAAASLPQRFMLLEAAAQDVGAHTPAGQQPPEAQQQLHAHLQHSRSASSRRGPFSNDVEPVEYPASMPASRHNTGSGMAPPQQLSRVGSALVASLRVGLHGRSQLKSRTVVGAVCVGSMMVANGGGSGPTCLATPSAPCISQSPSPAAMRSPLGAYGGSCGSLGGPPAPAGSGTAAAGPKELMRALQAAQRNLQNVPPATAAPEHAPAAAGELATRRQAAAAMLASMTSTTDLEDVLVTKEEANTATEGEEQITDAPLTDETDEQFEAGEEVSIGTVGLSTIMSANASNASGRGGANERGGVSVLLLRGLRVRMGCASGVQSQAEVSYNTRMARTVYSGRPLAAAKAISGAGAGGIVLVSQCTHRLVLKQRAEGGGKQHAGYVELSLSDSVRSVGGDATAAGSQRAVFWYGGCAVLEPQLPAMELYQAATPAQALRWSALPLPASGPKVQLLSRCVQSAPVGQLAVAVVAVSGAGCIGTLEAPDASTDGLDPFAEPGTSPMWRAVAGQLWSEAARLCLARGGYLATRRSALLAMAPEVMADSVVARPIGNKVLDKADDGGGGGGVSKKAPAASRPRRSLELARIGAAFKGSGGGSRALRERSGRAGQVLLTAVFPSPAAAVLWCAELLATGLCAPWPEQLLQSELGEAMWVGPGAELATDLQQQHARAQQLLPSQLAASLLGAQQPVAGLHASAAGSPLFCGIGTDACGNVSGSALGCVLGTSAKPTSDSQWHFRTPAPPPQLRPLSQGQQQLLPLFNKPSAVSPADALLGPLLTRSGHASAGSRPAAVEQPGDTVLAAAALDVGTGQQSAWPWHAEESTTATAAAPPSLLLEEAPSLRLLHHPATDDQPKPSTGRVVRLPSADAPLATGGAGGGGPATAAATDQRRRSAENAAESSALGSEVALRPQPWRGSGAGPAESDSGRSPQQRLPTGCPGRLVCRGPRLRAGVEFGSAAVEINPLTGAARYEGAAVSRAMALALSAPVTRVHVSEPVAAAVACGTGRDAGGDAAAAALGVGSGPAPAGSGRDSGGGTAGNTTLLPPPVLLSFMRSTLLVTRAAGGGGVVTTAIHE